MGSLLPWIRSLLIRNNNFFFPSSPLSPPSLSVPLSSSLIMTSHVTDHVISQSLPVTIISTISS